MCMHACVSKRDSSSTWHVHSFPWTFGVLNTMAIIIMMFFSVKKDKTADNKKHQAFAIPAPEQWRRWHLLCTSLHLATVSAALRYTWASLHVAPSLPESKAKNAVIDHWDEPQVLHNSNYIYSLNLCFQADPPHSSRTWLCMGKYSFTQRVFYYPPKWCAHSTVWLSHGWCFVKLLMSWCTFCVQHHFIQSHICRVHVFSGTLVEPAMCNFGTMIGIFYMSYCGVTGWNGYQNKSQHRKLTVTHTNDLLIKSGTLQSTTVLSLPPHIFDTMPHVLCVLTAIPTSP